MNNNLETDVRKLNDTVAVIDIHGKINGSSEDELLAAYQRAGSNGTEAIILNFSDLSYMNSSGIGLLVKVLIRVRRHRQQLLAYGLADHYKEIFELTRLDESIHIFDSEEEALAGVDGTS
ncbi:MAG: STAS domain-containing protein [Candidatus Promineifilaceae bacterium]